MFQALEETADGQFRVLIGIDDSSEEDSIQKNEIAYLRAQLRQGDALLSGVDDLAFKAVTKLCLEEWGWEGAAVSVQYFGGTEDRPACAYDYQPLEAIVAEHFDFFDLTMAEPGGEELAMLVLTQPGRPGSPGDVYQRTGPVSERQPGCRAAYHPHRRGKRHLRDRLP